MTSAFWLGIVSGILLMGAIFSASDGFVLFPILTGVAAFITAFLGFHEV